MLVYFFLSFYRSVCEVCKICQMKYKMNKRETQNITEKKLVTRTPVRFGHCSL